MTGNDPLADADDICRMTAAELTEAYRTRALSPVEAARATLRRAEVINGQFNAFTHIDADVALAAAAESEARWQAGTPLSPIDGVPTTIKDIVWVKGWTVRFGTRAIAGVNAEADAPSVALLRRAGAVLLGLTTTPEFGWKAVTDSPLSGITRNPWNPDRTPGGSSGGAAVAAATGAGVLHLGTDGGGSIRIPASFTGLVGHKPSFGRVPAYPASPFGTVAHVGPITRTADDAIRMLDVMSGKDRRDWYQNPLPFPPAGGGSASFKDVRIGLWRVPPGQPPSAPVAAAFDAAADRLAALGAIVEPVALPPEDLDDLFRIHWFAGAAQRLRAVPADRLDLVDPGLRDVARQGAEIDLPTYMDAVIRRANFAAAMGALLDRFQLLASPATAITAFTAGAEVAPGGMSGRWTGWAGFSFPMNLSQQPACVVPCGFDTDGMPIGLQFAAARGADHLALAAVRAWQEAAPPGRL